MSHDPECPTLCGCCDGYVCPTHRGERPDHPEPAPRGETESANVFHIHLDACRQCREHPFALCQDGARLLQQAATR